MIAVILVSGPRSASSTSPAGTSSPSPAAGTATTGSGTVTGTVTEGPTTPDCRDNEPCERPAANRPVTAQALDGRQAGRAQTNGTGHYSLDLPAGTYRIKVDGGLNQHMVEVKVVSGQTTTQDISLDTGIR